MMKKANVVVVGGGVIGSSIGYHLGKLGVRDVVVVEQNRVTSGTTWHAAGLMVTFGSLSHTSTKIRQYSRELYSQILPTETGQSTGWNPVGFIEIAAPDRVEEFRRIAAFNRKCGVTVEELSPQEVQARFPLCRVDDIAAGFFVPDDGRVNPVDVTMALVKGAKMYGVSFIEGARATGVTSVLDRSTSKMNRRVTGLTLADGSTIECNTVVNAAGMWARQFGERCGVNVPLQAAEHYYLITEPMKEVDKSWPVIEDPSSYTYIRPEAGGLMVGLFESTAAAWNVKSIPDDFSFGQITPDYDRMMPYVEKAMARVPATATTGIKTYFCGPESFTPDLQPVVGEAPELQNYFVCAGLNSIGILSGGGLGRLVAEWIKESRPTEDVTGFNIDRFHPYQRNPEYRSARVVETLGMVYTPHFPYKSKQTARKARISPFYDILIKEKHAFCKDVSGWESPDFYAPTAALATVDKHSWNAREYHWFDYWRQEHFACRNDVVLIDMSFMSKFLVQGADAGAALNRLSTAHVDGKPETITYTQWLNEDGRMEADLTISKLQEDKFLVIATDTMHRHVETHLRRNINPHGRHHVFFHDATESYAQLNIQGPNSRLLMQLVTDCDMSNESFPFRTIKEIAIGYARVYCARITYVGELGYELFIPTSQAVHVYRRLVEEYRRKQQRDLPHAGLKALSSLRLEKGYKDFGHDMDNTDSLLEVGLGFTADWNKPGGFIGREALLTQKEQLAKQGGLTRRLCSILCLDENQYLYHGEVVWRDGIIVGDVRIGSYGHTLGGAVGLAMIDASSISQQQKPAAVVNKAFLETGRWEVEINGKKFPVRLSLQPFVDPKNEKIKV